MILKKFHQLFCSWPIRNEGGTSWNDTTRGEDGEGVLASMLEDALVVTKLEPESPTLVSTLDSSLDSQCTGSVQLLERRRKRPFCFLLSNALSIVICRSADERHEINSVGIL